MAFLDPDGVLGAASPRMGAVMPQQQPVDGLGALRAEIGDSGSQEIGSYSDPDDQASLAPQLHAPTSERQGLDASASEAPGGIVFGGTVTGGGHSGSMDEDVRAALAGVYGPSFPLLAQGPDSGDWVNWARNLWESYAPGVQAILHLVERNRLFYEGVQWVSSIGYGPWREPAKPRDAARVVDNKIQPALDMRTQLLAEQRPGFNCTPASGDPDAMKKAEADQVALEYQWHEQDMQMIAREAGYYVGTDGVCFLELYWDHNRGPWYEIPHDVTPDEGSYPLGKQPGDKFPMGDCRTRVRKIEQVRVSPDATGTRPPMIWVIREIVSKAEAIKDHGAQVANEPNQSVGDDSMTHITVSRHGYILPADNELARQQDTVVRHVVYCEPSEFLPEGLMMCSVGDALTLPPTPLPYGRVPMVRWTDGSMDPSFYCMPVMQQWIDDQTRVNAIWSKWIENLRKGANTNLIARDGIITGETMIGGTLNVFNVKGGMPLADVVQTLGPFDLSPGAQAALALITKSLEDRTGYNDVTRGAFPGDQSGRAILAVREQVERIFAPFVNAASEAMCQWGEITLAMMKANYDLPRLIAVEGQSRPDLGQLLTGDDLDVAAQVWVDPETLMPMPRSMRLAVLDDMLQKQLITPQEYRRRMPFAMVKNLDTPDQDQSARANRIADTIRRTGDDSTLPILWMDDEAQHQDVLERQIIFDDDLNPQVRSVAYERWMRLAQQAMMKQQGMPLPPGEPHPLAPPGGTPPSGGGALPGQTTATGLQGAAAQLGAAQAPVGPMSPVASTPMTQIGLPDQLQAASRFEQTAPH